MEADALCMAVEEVASSWINPLLLWVVIQPVVRWELVVLDCRYAAVDCIGSVD